MAKKESALQVKALTVGPIVGATEIDSVRLWGRGNVPTQEDGQIHHGQRCFGAARLRPLGSKARYQKRVFKMNPNFDFTGLALFDGLKPDTEYEYQVGYFFSEHDVCMESIQVTLRWSAASEGQFCTSTTDMDKPRSYLFGSCRYLLRLYLGELFDDRGDKTFRSMLQQIEEQERPVDALLMLGDQIYADDLDFFAADQRLSDYFERYRDVFSQPHLRRLMSRVSTYMTLDDHEIEDNWPRRASRKDFLQKFPVAMHAYLTYQASHSPLLQTSEDGRRLRGIPDHLWYSFQDGCCDFFVTDTRTERRFFDDPLLREIISQQQLEALLAWLDDGSGKVKIIATSVPFFPDPILEAEQESWDGADKWSGFLAQRTHILEFIRLRSIRKVIFLSGDIHLSVSAELVHGEDPDFQIVSIISSPLFWPYPHQQPDTFITTGQIQTSPPNLGYTLNKVSEFTTTDNFTRITVDPTQVQVEVYGRKGELLATRVHQLKP